MNKLIASLAIMAAALAAHAQVSIEADKVSVEFAPGTNIQYEIDLADTALAAMGTDIRMDDEWTTDGNQTILEIDADSAPIVTFLVNSWFPRRSSVTAANFVYDDQDTDDELVDCDGSVNSTMGGANVLLSAKLNKPAPVGGAWVALKSSSVYAAVPAKVFIAAGKTSVSFFVKTTAPLRTVRAKITGSYRGHLNTSILTVKK